MSTVVEVVVAVGAAVEVGTGRVTVVVDEVGVAVVVAFVVAVEVGTGRVRSY